MRAVVPDSSRLASQLAPALPKSRYPKEKGRENAHAKFVRGIAGLFQMGTRDSRYTLLAMPPCPCAPSIYLDTLLNRPNNKEKFVLTTFPSSSPVYTFSGMGKIQVMGAAALGFAGSLWLSTLMSLRDHFASGCVAGVVDCDGGGNDVGADVVTGAAASVVGARWKICNGD